MLIKLIKITSLSLLLVSCGEIQQQIEELQSKDSGVLTEDDIDDLLETYGLSEDGEEIDDGDRDSRENKILERLSEEAQEVFAEVKIVGDAHRVQMDSVCSRNSDLRESIKTELRSIFEDETLSDDEKRAAVIAIKDANKDAMEQERDTFESCVDVNQETLDAIREEFSPIAEACLIPKPGHDKEGRNGGKNPPPSRLTDESDEDRGPSDEQIAEFEAKLTSDECRTALDTL